VHNGEAVDRTLATDWLELQLLRLAGITGWSGRVIKIAALPAPLDNEPLLFGGLPERLREVVCDRQRSPLAIGHGVLLNGPGVSYPFYRWGRLIHLPARCQTLLPVWQYWAVLSFSQRVGFLLYFAVLVKKEG